MSDVTDTTNAGIFAHIEITGGPSPEQVAAIVSALQSAWPTPAPPTPPTVTSSSWRHADRWWNQGRLPSGWAARQL